MDACNCAQPRRTEGNFTIAATACAFDADGNFTSDNWGCVTMGKLRDLCVIQHRDDSVSGSIGVVVIGDNGESTGDHIVMSWYKNRGRTAHAVVMGCDEAPRALTYADAVEAVQWNEEGECER